VVGQTDQITDSDEHRNEETQTRAETTQNGQFFGKRGRPLNAFCFRIY